MTHTYAILEISSAAFEEIKAKLEAADYQHLFAENGTVIDMYGIAVKATPKDGPNEQLLKGELHSAWVSTELAIRDLIQDSQTDLQQRAEQYGRRISQPDHIRQVLDCIDINRLLSLTEQETEG